MTPDDIRIVAAKIDAAIRQQMWCDFEMQSFAAGELRVTGTLDTSSEPFIEIAFGDVSFVAMPLEWKSDTSRLVFELLQGDRAYELNRRYQVEQGFHVFRFVAEGYPADFGCLVGAKTLSYHLLRI